MVAETIYMAWNSILCYPYSVDCHSFAHLNRWCKCGASLLKDKRNPLINQ